MPQKGIQCEVVLRQQAAVSSRQSDPQLRSPDTTFPPPTLHFSNDRKGNRVRCTATARGRQADRQKRESPCDWVTFSRNHPSTYYLPHMSEMRVPTGLAGSGPPSTRHVGLKGNPRDTRPRSRQQKYTFYFFSFDFLNLFLQIFVRNQFD